MVIKKIEARDALDIAKRAYETSGQVFRYAVSHGLCESNPVAQVKPADFLKPSTQENYKRVAMGEINGCNTPEGKAESSKNAFRFTFRKCKIASYWLYRQRKRFERGETYASFAEIDAVLKWAHGKEDKLGRFCY